MSQTLDQILGQGEERWPVDLAAEGLDQAAKYLRKKSFLLLLARLDCLPPDLPAVLSVEHQEAESYPDALRRHGHVARRQIVRGVLSRHLRCPPDAIAITRDPSGAPRLAGAGMPFHVSFAARGEIALIGIAREPLGVDLEIAVPGIEIPWNMLRMDERDTLRAIPEEQRGVAFLRLWAAKEAAAKALGTGFSLPPEAIRIEGFPHEAQWQARPEARAADVAIRIQCRKIDDPGLKLQDKVLERGLTGGLVVAAASIA